MESFLYRLIHLLAILIFDLLSLPITAHFLVQLPLTTPAPRKRRDTTTAKDLENGEPFPSPNPIGYITSHDFELRFHGAPREGAPERPLGDTVLLDLNFAREVAHDVSFTSVQSTESQFVEGEQQSFAWFAPSRPFDESPEYPSAESGGRKFQDFFDSSPMQLSPTTPVP